MNTILILGSAPDATRARTFDPAPFAAIVAINNAWRIRPDWTHAIFPDDFPASRRPKPGKAQNLVTSDTYVPSNNRYGGIVYAGATMALTTAYWALDALKPDMIAFIGCDMVYDAKHGENHFYGTGTADPLRNDPTLQSLEAKSARLALLAAKQKCACVNLSDLPESRLAIPRGSFADLISDGRAIQHNALSHVRNAHDEKQLQAALEAEADAAICVEDGRYWQRDLDADRLAKIDSLWLSASGMKVTTD